MPEQRLSVLQRLLKAARFVMNPASINKKTPFTNTTLALGNTPQYPLESYSDFYQEGYRENSLIYSAVTYKAKSFVQAKLTAYKYTDNLGNYDKLEWGNDLQRLLDKPNSYQSASEFFALQNVFFNLTGNAFTYFERDKQKNIKSFWPLNPAYVTIVPDNKSEIAGYEYRPYWSGGEPFPIAYNDMAHWKLPNPNDQLNGLGFGMSPILALAQAGDVDNMISRFLNTFFKHGALPAGLLKFKDMPLDENEINEIREKWSQIYGGYNNWSDIGILDQYGEYQRIGFSFTEMDFEKLDRRNETKIFATLGVPLELLPTVSGLVGSTYNNKLEARKMFWQDTMLYELEVVEQELGRIFNDDENGIFVKFDLSGVHGLKGDIAIQVEAASKLYAMKVPPRIAFETVGLSVTDYEGIDDVQETPKYSGFGETDDSSLEKPNPDTDTANQDENNKNNPFFKNEGVSKNNIVSIFDTETKKKLYKGFDDLAKSHEDDFLKAAIRSFDYDQKNILSILSDFKTKALERKSNIIWNDAIDPVDKYLFSESKTNWRNEFAPALESIYGDTEKFWYSQLGLQFNIRNIEGEYALDQYTLVFSNQIAKTNSDSIKKILQYGYRDGATIDQMTNNINDLYSGWSKWRGELIARTETTRAANDGARKLYKRWGVEQKEWLSTMDDRTRDSHIAMDGQIKDIDEPFESPTGAKLMQPGDSSAPLSETAACRCTTLPVIDKKLDVQKLENFNNEFVFSGQPEDEFLENSQDFFGKSYSKNDILNKLGLNSVELTNSEFDMYAGYSNMQIVGKSDQIKDILRIFKKDSNGNIYVTNSSFELNPNYQKGGIGSKIFSSQVEELSKAGINRIETNAARATNKNGYYTWARLGYDTNLDSSFTNKLPNNLKGATKLSDLMKTSEGREYWKENGFSVNLVFDLTPNSLSMRILDEYMKSKGYR